MRSLFFLIYILLFVGNISAQFDFGKYFETSTSDPEFSLLKNQTEFMQQENFNLPWIREIEMRIRTNDANTSPEDYRFRLEFTNPLVHRATKKYNQKYEENLKIQTSNVFNQVLYLRYQLLVRSFEMDQKVRRLQAAIDRLKDLREMALINQASRDVLKVEVQFTKLELEIHEMKTEKDFVNELINKLSNQSINPDWSNFDIVNPDVMWQVINLTNTQEMPLIRQINSELELANEEFKLECNNARRIRAFIQSEYDSDRGNMPNEHWGFQIGIGIPFIHSDRTDLQYERLNLIELETESALLLSQFEQRLDELKKNFLSKQTNWEKVEEKIFKTHQLPETNNLSLLLDIFEYQEELAEIRSGLYMDMVMLYIEILSMQGRFNKQERMNFLSNGLEPW